MRPPGLVGLLVIAAAAGCTSALRVDLVQQPTAGALRARPDTCAARLYLADEPLPATCVEVGDVFVGDTGWTFGCDAQVVRAEVRRQTCLFGADAAQIIREQEPSLLGSSCDQIRARLVTCSGKTAP